MNWYARGKPGEVPHFSTNQNLAERARQPGEVILELKEFPEAHCRLNSDGTGLEETGEGLDPWLDIQIKRNQLLDQYRWTIAIDSPLTPECQAAWLQYLKTLHRITVDFPSANLVVWPVQPTFEYAS